jgi:hypothetical protein
VFLFLLSLALFLCSLILHPLLSTAFFPLQPLSLSPSLSLSLPPPLPQVSFSITPMISL